MTLAAVQAAAGQARSAAGPGAGAAGALMLAKLDLDVEENVKRLRAALRGLRGIERDALRLMNGRALRFTSLLGEIEGAVGNFEAARPAHTPARRRGQRASAEEKAANARYVAAIFAHHVRRPAEPRDLAITEIALGRAPKCVDTADFRDRCKRWSKFTASRAARNTPTI